MREFKNSNMFQYDNGPPGGSGGGFHGPGYGGGSSGSDFRAIKPDIAIKGTRATREVTTIRGTSSSSSRVTRAIPSS